VKLHLDTFHMNIEEKNQAAAIRKAGKLLGHFHACGSDRGTPGGDHIDWPNIVKALKEIGYQGDVVVESFTTDVKVIARPPPSGARSSRSGTTSPSTESSSSARPSSKSGLDLRTPGPRPGSVPMAAHPARCAAFF
jgi:hypothetical protein